MKKKQEKSATQKIYQRQRVQLRRRADVKKKINEAIFCEKCGITFNQNSKTKHKTLDHIIPLSKGGPNKIENTAVLCHPCNVKKGDK